MIRRLPVVILVFVGVVLAHKAHAALVPRDGWKFVPGAQDLIQAGNWGCVAGVALNSGALTIAAPANAYNTAINNTGPTLLVGGDFSVLASITVPTESSVALSLVGSLGYGPDWWNGLNRLDVGVSNGNLQVSFWTGSSPAPQTQTFGAISPAGPLYLEVALRGGQIVIYTGGNEAARLNDPGLFASGQVFFGFNVAPSATLIVSALAASIPASGTNARFVDAYSQTVQRGTQNLRDFAGQQGLLLGAAVNPLLIANPDYARTLAVQANAVVAENAMKFAQTEPAPYQYNFCQADQLVRFAQANGMQVRGHNLVWHQSLPAWLTGGNYSSTDAAKILQDHIHTVATHFRGKVVAWDVVNEAISYSAPYGPQPSYWLTQLGSGYIDQAFRWAHDADPGAKLFYNDTGGEGLGAKSDAVYNLVSGMISRGVPINGVGLEMHVDLKNAPAPADVSANIQRLGQLGLEVHITEMDVRLPLPANGQASSADLIAQAAIYDGILSACLANTNCTGFLTWGVSDANSWIPSAFPGFGAPLLFDMQFAAKPAASQLLSRLSATALKPKIFDSGVVIHGGAITTVSPGSLVDIYGSALATSIVLLDSGALRLPVTLANTQVTVNNILAPVLYVSPGQVIFQMPSETPVGAAQVVVLSNGILSPSATVHVQTAAPGILTYGENRAVALNQDQSVNSETKCAAIGTTSVLYAIGSGPVDNPVSSGAFTPLAPLARETLATQIYVGGQPAQVQFAGLVPTTVGLMQANFVVPDVPAGDQPLQLMIGTSISNAPLFCVAAP